MKITGNGGQEEGRGGIHGCSCWENVTSDDGSVYL